MRRAIIYVIACALAALVPFLPAQSKQSEAATNGIAFSGWPTSFEGRALMALPLSEREQRFGNDFPGRVARFTDGRREVIIRWVTEATRKLHPASDCFEATGYRVHPLPLRVDESGIRWGSFTATRGDEKLRVYERIYAESGESWTDASSWYWAAIGGRSAGPWWAVTVAEKETAATL